MPAHRICVAARRDTGIVVGEPSGSFQAYQRSNGDLALGLRGNAVAVEVNQTRGVAAIPFNSQRVDAQGNRVQGHLFAASVTGSAGVGVNAGAGIRSERVHSAGPVSVHAVTIDANGFYKFVGAGAEITVPDVRIFCFSPALSLATRKPVIR